MKKFIFIITFILVPSYLTANDTKSAHALETACAIEGSYVKVTALHGDINTNDFAEEGKIGVVATVTGNNNTIEAFGDVHYEKIGNRLEIDRAPNFKIGNGTTPEDIIEQFGKFPTVICKPLL